MEALPDVVKSGKALYLGASSMKAWQFARHAVVTATLVGATKSALIDDAVASLEIDLTAEEVRRFEAPHTPRRDEQGDANDAQIRAFSAQQGASTFRTFTGMADIIGMPLYGS